MIDHAITLLEGTDVTKIVANLHYKPDSLRTHLEGKGVLTIEETPDILETGGGLRNALGLLGSAPVFTLNTDAIWQGPSPVPMLAEMWDPTKMDALLIGIPIAQAEGYIGNGDFTIAQNGTLTRGLGLIFGGVQIIKTDLLAEIPNKSFSLNLLWDKMLAKGRLYGLPYPGRWCDVGHPEGITLAEKMLSNV